MKRNLGLAFVAAGALAVGVALAQPSSPQAASPQDPPAIDRLATLEKQVAQLQSQVAGLSKAKPAAAAPGAEGTEARLDALEAQMEQVLGYLAAQAESAKRLQEALDDSREKGFTYGINPDSRIVMLQGFGQFTSTLQADVPSAKPTVEPAQQGRAVRR